MLVHKIHGRSYADRDEMALRVAELDAQYAGQMPQQARDEWNSLNEAIEELDVRLDRVRELSTRSANREDGAGFHTPRNTAAGAPDADLRSRALAANERADFLPDIARDHMERTLRDDDDPQHRLARFTVELSDRAYFRAFSKLLNDPVSGGHEWTDQEREAVQRVRALERSLTLSTAGTGGGFLVPYELDPAILQAGVGAISPLRELARVETTAQNEKRFVTSLGVTAHWDPEETETTDDAPTLLQPTITCKKGSAFVPVSYELFEDSDMPSRSGRCSPTRRPYRRRCRSRSARATARPGSSPRW
jgi:HK97 family phage major capsid protein